MEKRKVDVAIIGAGTAGLGAYREARKYTDNLLLIESGPYGTTCARVGCMPSKLLIAAAEAAHDADHASLFGVHAGDVKIDGREVMARVQRERDRFVRSVLDSVESLPEDTRICGRARFTGPQTLQVDDTLEVEAERIVVATGSRPHVPGFLEEAGDRLLTSDTLFELPDLPKSMAIFGPGVVGLELGQALSRLGVDVRMFGKGGAVGPLQDNAIHGEALRIFNEEFYLDPEAEVKAVERTADGVAVSYRHRDQGEITETFDYVLAATGRRPNMDRVDIQNSGLELDDKGMPDHNPNTMRSGTSAIFVAGDVSNEIPLLHEASDEGHIAGINAGRYPEVRATPRRTPLAIVFTAPQIATVGETMASLQDRKGDGFAVGQVSFEDQGRSRVMGKNKGLLRLYGEFGSGLLLGAEMLGPAAEHIAHLLAWSIQNRMTVLRMLEMPFYHPVIEEGVRTALRDLNHNLNMGPQLDDQCMECGPGA